MSGSPEPATYTTPVTPARTRRWSPAVTSRSGALIAEGGLAALECSAERLVTAGDHLLVIAGVTGVPYHTATGEPLIRFRSRYLPARL